MRNSLSSRLTSPILKVHAFVCVFEFIYVWLHFHLCSSMRASLYKSEMEVSLFYTAIGVTNQRETTLVWDKETGEPLYNAIGESAYPQGNSGEINIKCGPS